MIRVLHLLDHPAEFEPQRVSGALASGLGAEFAVTRASVGMGGTYRNTVAAVAGIRRQIKEKAYDVVHAFSAAGLTAAALAGNVALVFTPSPAVRPGTVRWLRAVQAYRRVEVVCPTSTLRRVLVEHGIGAGTVHLIRPAVDFSRVRKRRDVELRARLGFGDGDRVILAAGESTRPAAHGDAAWAAGILHVADARYKLLLWGRGPQIGQVADYRARWPMPDLISVAEERLGRAVEFEELLPAADMIMVTARGPVATLPIAMGMASGLPIVSTVTYTVSELLEDRHTALMAPGGKPRLLARRVLDLEEEPGVQWSIADMARTEAFEYFAMSRMLKQYRGVYRQVAEGEPVRVEEQGAGAGLRFHGRA
ncbi:MAG TPA: glycosyltransferase [Tepidisphaeraceae bacterium]|jgi:glycosyltransferase involved in cell wall biosynthesis